MNSCSASDVILEQLTSKQYSQSYLDLKCWNLSQCTNTYNILMYIYLYAYLLCCYILSLCVIGRSSGCYKCIGKCVNNRHRKSRTCNMNHWMPTSKQKPAQQSRSVNYACHTYPIITHYYGIIFKHIVVLIMSIMIGVLLWYWITFSSSLLSFIRLNVFF